MRTSIALSTFILMGSVCAQQTFLTDFESAVHKLQQGASNRIDMRLDWYPTLEEKYALVGKFRVGAGPALNGTNETNVNLVIDTRYQRTFFFDSNCTTCNVTNKYSLNPNSTTTSLNTNKVRHVFIKDGYQTNDTVCVADSNGGGNMKCAPNRIFSVIRDQEGFNASGIDGLMGLGRIVPGDNDNKTQFIAGLVKQNDTSLIQSFTAYLDIKNNEVHLGTPRTDRYRNTTLKGFLDFHNQRNMEVQDDGFWAVRIEDFMYGTPINGTSLDDNFTDLAVIDTMFPGIMIPERVWANFNKTIIKNITMSTGTNVTCNQTERIYGIDYEFCYSNKKCSDIRNKLFDIYLYFNGTKTYDQTTQDFTQYILAMSKNDYAIDWKLPYLGANNETLFNETCKYLVYSKLNSKAPGYTIGNAVLSNYYVMLNFTDPVHQHIGFNGDYWEVTYKPGDPTKPDKPPAPAEDTKGSPLIVILIIAGALLFVAIGVCIYIKKRNEKLQGELHNDTKYSSLAH